MELSELPPQQLQLASKTVGFLAVDAVQKANSGHPGMPMGMADSAITLWLKYLNYNPQQPDWINRDRFVLSNGHGSMLLYAMLHLSGYDVSLEDLKNFRQWESKTPGHPESFMTPGVECTTGPLGQGVANAVGMAIGQKQLAERYRSKSDPIIDHRVFCFTGDGCLMEGVSGEASSIAGHLGLGNLNVLYDDNEITIAGKTSLAFSEDVAKRYQAYGWHTVACDGHDFNALDAAFAEAVSETKRPSLILARTIIGKGSPQKAGTSGVHGSPLGDDEVANTKDACGWPQQPTFHVPDEVRELFAERREELGAVFEKCNQRFEAWKKADADSAAALERQITCSVPADLTEKIMQALPSDGKPAATRKLSSAALQVVSREVNALLGGSADLEPSTLTVIKDSGSITKDSFSGLNLHCGIREHAMGAVMNGLSYYGGFIPYGSTFLCFFDYMKPTVRLAALSQLRGLFIYTHDSIFLGEDGPTHQPIEHVNALRMIPNLYVFRPADALETAVSYHEAVKRTDGPSAFCLSRQNIAPLDTTSSISADDVRRGAYVARESDGEPAIIFVATGSEVPLAISTAQMLDGVSTRVVSMPCWELFRQQDTSYRESLIPADAKVVVVEAGSPFGWCDMLGTAPKNTLVVGVDSFGASAPALVLAEKFGFTPEQIVEKVKTKLL